MALGAGNDDERVLDGDDAAVLDALGLGAALSVGTYY